MIAVLLALASAAAYGTSDFVGGVTSRRASPWQVAVVGVTVGGLWVTLAALLLPGTPTGADLAWGALAGIGNGLGGAFLYRGLSRGRMGVVGPVSAVGAALLPVVVGVGLGERPGLLVWLGIAVALPGIWLVAREPGAGRLDAGLVDGLLAGAGFGLLFAALGQVPDGAGLWPVAVSQLTGVVAVVALAAGLRQPWLPRSPTPLLGGGATGSLSILAVVGFLLATQQGLLAVSAVLASLYPAVTVLLARVVLGERLHPAQVGGLVACGGAVVLVVLG
ncbi:EamA family transporter [Nocardioides marmoraquaticus]